jgi:hypothetical protein
MSGNPYESIFNDTSENENPGQERFSPYLSTINKANSFPEINKYPSFTIGDSIKKIDNENVNHNSLEEFKTSKFIFIKN